MGAVISFIRRVRFFHYHPDLLSLPVVDVVCFVFFFFFFLKNLTISVSLTFDSAEAAVAAC